MLLFVNADALLHWIEIDIHLQTLLGETLKS